MPDKTGIQLIKYLKQYFPELGIIIITGYGTMETSIQALRAGASDYLLKPIDLEQLQLSIEKTFNYIDLVKKNIKYSEYINELKKENIALSGGINLIGESNVIKEIKYLINKVAESPDSSVLITGESGTGKELVARLIHNKSQRKANSIVSVNCSAFTPGLIESELFGSEKGSYTGSYEKKKGVFELADKGTLFLDEIGDMPLNLQGSLLRVLEERKIRRIGGMKNIPIDVRLISSTNLNLEKMVSEKKFRNDLFYRLRVFSIEVPALKKRKDDVPILINYYIDFYSKKLRKKISGIQADVLDKLMNYDFPGNVRELKNLVEQAAILNETGILNENDFRSLYVMKNNFDSKKDDCINAGIDKKLVDSEKSMIINILSQTNNNLTKTAEILQLGYGALRYRIQKYNIKL
jgi:DNA-binding NtrC family response regulator